MKTLLATLLLLAGCSSAPQEMSSGQVRTDNTPQSGACRITVLGSSQRPHYDLKVVTESGAILLDARVPKANTKPGVWKSFHADIGSQTISVTAGDRNHKVTVKPDTVELVVTETDITQYPKRVGWR